MMMRVRLSNENFTCSNGTDGYCTIKASCKDWGGFTNGLAFKIYFRDQDSYVMVALAAFAEEHADGNCRVHINSIGTENTDPIILGSMFIQQFAMLTEVNYLMNSNTI
jgi:hypothetical protein